LESYGVIWQEGGLEPVAGKLEIGLDFLRLEGSGRDRLAVCALAFGDLTGIRIGRERRERLDGRPTLLLERSGGETIRIAGLAQAGIVTEIAERLAGFEPRIRSAG
jgi:hypothetical protein